MALDNSGLGIMRTEVGKEEGAMVERHLFVIHRRYMLGEAIKRSDSYSLWFFWVRRAEECNLDSMLATSFNSKRLLDYQRSCACQL